MTVQLMRDVLFFNITREKVKDLRGLPPFVETQQDACRLPFQSGTLRESAENYIK